MKTIDSVVPIPIATINKGKFNTLCKNKVQKAYDKNENK